MSLAETAIFEPFYLPGSAGRLFALLQAPAEPTSHPAVLFVPPFAEEMNKSRRQVALQTRRLVAAGFPVLIIDLHGTGDSDGEFVESRWTVWRDDVLRAAAWLEDRTGRPPLLWGLRLGGLLAVQALQLMPRAPGALLLWAPVQRGDSYLNSFLRMRVAADMLSERRGETTAALREALASGATVEIGGYELHPELAAAIGSARLDDVQSRRLPPTRWFEVSAAGDRPLPVPVQHLLRGWRDAGVDAQAQTVQGDAFWATAEIATAPVLIDATCRALEELRTWK